MRVIRTQYYLNRPKALLSDLDAIETVDKSAVRSEGLLGWRIRAQGLLNNFDEALKLVEKYRQRYPNNLFPTFQQIYLLGRLGRVDASVAVWAEAERLPGAGTRYGALLRNGSLAFLRGRIPPAELRKLAEEVLRWGDSRPARDWSAETFSPLRRSRVTALKMLERYEDVKKELERTPLAARTQAFENWNLWWSEWGVNAVQRGDQVEARATLQWLNEREPKFQFGKWHYARAKIHATLGERTEALRALREAIAQSYPLAGEAQTAEFDALRDDPEFKALIEPNG
jgi:tetratricopeptide (TPR) repeat protein